jgi:hypothetical protein
MEMIHVADDNYAPFVFCFVLFMNFYKYLKYH